MPGIFTSGPYREIRTSALLPFIEICACLRKWGWRLDEVHCYYELRQSNEHYHLVCSACGRVLEFESPMVGKLVDEVERNSDFHVLKAVLYLEGYCKKCEGKEQAE